MKPVKLLMITAVVALVVITAVSLYTSQQGVTSETETVEAYQASVLQSRAEKHQFMKTDEESPFLVQKESFDSLNYFDINPEFKVTASVEKIENGKVHQLQTSDDSVKVYQEVAILHFDILGSHEDLTLLQSADRDHYFLPFYDETSAISTYGAGRYLETEYDGTQSKITLDFNYAYNPYCAYVKGYSCPVPPPQNQISIAITAGEKNFD
jgi:uncharacterized protein (DUF1684 family)